MKIIDLLNKMANDSEYKPKTVIHKGILYRYNEPVYEFYDDKVGLFGAYQIERFLNDEIEIIEEEKEIEETDFTFDNTIWETEYQTANDIEQKLINQNCILKNKLDELVREFNKLKKDK